MTVGRDRVGVGLTRSTIRPLLPCLFLVKGASKYRPHGTSEPQATSTASSWVGHHTDKDGLLLKH